jgi:hypothetical protein
VATSADALVFLLKGPGLGSGLGRYSLVSPFSEEWDGRVVEVF